MKPFPVLLTLFAACITSSNAAILVHYDFLSTSGSAATTISTANIINPSGYTASTLLGGPGLQGSISPAGDITATSTTNTAEGNTKHLVIRTIGTDSTGATDITGAIAANDYYGFTIQATSGQALNLTSFGIDLGQSGGFSGNVYLRSSLDGFSTNLNVYSMSGLSTTLSTQTAVNLNPATFSNLTEAVTFRLYFADNSSATTTGVVFRVDNVILNGDVIPEPTSSALAALGVVALASRRRR